MSTTLALSAERLEEALDVRGVERGGGIAARLVDAGGERLFALLQFEHPLFDGALGDELVDEDQPLVADSDISCE